MNLTELESKREQLVFLKVITDSSNLRNTSYSYYMGGIYAKDKWFWEGSNTLMSFPLIWHSGSPVNSGKENCLIVQKRSAIKEAKFDDLNCEINIHVLCVKQNNYDNM